jgi:beta-glucosidase
VESLGFQAEDGSYTVEAGAIQVFVGGNSLAEQAGEAEVVNTIRIPPNESRASNATSIVQ